MSSQITKPPFTSFLKPLTEALFTEQDHNSQIGVALCLASAIDATPDPEPAQLRKLLPKFDKLLRSESFKAKPALLTVFGSVISSGGASSQSIVKNLVSCVMEFLSSEDWAVRKASAETLLKLAVEERDMLSEYKASCLKTFENRRFDKVKVVRDTMNQMLEVWKEVPDLSIETSAPPLQSQSSSKENASDGHYPPGSQHSSSLGSKASQMRKQNIPSNRSPSTDGSSATTGRKRSPLKSSDKNTGPAMFRKLDRKKPSNWNIEVSVPHAPSPTEVYKDDIKGREEILVKRWENDENTFSKLDTKRVLFTKKSDDKMHKLSGIRSGSRVVPFQDESFESTITSHKETEDPCSNHKESDELSLIRKQLVQIENQQSSLLDLLQKFMGSSQNGMHALETRVHGLELALDDISYDLAVSHGRMRDTGSARSSCADFLSPKFWRKTEYTAPRFSSSGNTPSTSTSRYRADKNVETFENRRFRLNGGGGFIVNPLAEISSESRGVSEVSSSRVLKNVRTS